MILSLILAAIIFLSPEPEGFPILEYHQVTDEPLDPDFEVYNVPPEEFAAQLDYLQQNGYTTITLQDFMRASHGKSTLPEKPIVLTFDDGYEDNYRNMLPILENHKICSAQKFEEAAKNEQMLRSFNIPAQNCEGYLFPDTYFFYENMDADEVIFQMISNFYKNLSTLGIEQIDFKTLTLASIVEREYRVEEEAPLIASVFQNRIEAGVGLYSCATIEYIITEIQGKPHPDIITYNDLKIDSPYNTYRWAALPPGPISNPGLVSLSASLNPPKTDYFFFTLSDAEAGRHTFSTNISQHINATAQFRTKRSN